ncbi:hypothetical protein PSH76_14560 [Pseudomonas sp. FP215]|uniref:hypothetical protein n=1 Tax=Pseudomonas sp. FP215 TaxID=2738126 RepID=UPI0027338EB6|nr:hypothetical protein [Pseudomonas sp. FP215]WLH26988.1 hypothetical protein PSH76_14560 [Pseudomonas sp. FP215]
MSSNPNVPLAPRAAPAAPTIVGALDDASGTILASNATADLTVRCKTGDFSDFDDFIQVEMADITQTLIVWVAVTPPMQMSTDSAFPIPDRFNITVPAPAGGFRHGFYQLRSVQYLNIGGVPAALGEHSDPGNFTVDLLSPYSDATFREQPNAVGWPATLPAGAVIDNNYLVMHGGVQFDIPDNTFVPVPGRWAAGDFITFYWSPVMFPRPMDIVSPPGGIPMLETGNTYFLPAAMIDVSGDYYAFYTLTDRAGNVSRPAYVETRRVALIDDPDRGTPHLPLAPFPDPGETDNLIDIKDYLLNPEVWVRTYNNHAPLLDRLEVDIGGLGYNGLGLPFTTFPQRFSNLQAAFRAAYTQAIGPQPTTVQYRISRNGTFFPSFPHTFMLDLSVGGPVNPGEPGSPNINLNQAHVFGAGSTTPDVLLPAHADQDVRVDIVPWTVAELPHAGLSIILLWEDERVGPFPVSATANPISFFIGWDVVARHGNDIKTIKYLVLDPAATTNENESPPTTVDVQGAVVVELAKAEYVVATAGRWFCSDLETRTPGTPPVLFGKVHVPGDIRMAVGVPLTLTLSLTNTHASLPPGPFPLTLTHPSLSPADIANGITFEIDYQPYLAQAPRGTCVATYETVLSNGVTGHGEPSVIRSTLANTHFFCDGANIPSP